MINTRRTKTRSLAPAGTLAIFALVACAVAWEFVEWSFNRIYVPKGKSLLLRYKGFPLLGSGLPPAKPGHFAQVDDSGRPVELGILERMRGPGRHFYCPLWWERELVSDTVIDAGEVGLVACK